MLKKILVATDSSPMGTKIFAAAIELGRHTNAHLMLLHVLSPADEGSEVELYPSLVAYPIASESNVALYRKQWDEYKGKSTKMLRDRLEEAKAAGINNVEFSQQIGNPSRAICDFAKEWEADTIVVGRRGHSGLSEFLMGSVSNYVLHHAPCSVFVVHR